MGPLFQWRCTSGGVADLVGRSTGRVHIKDVSEWCVDFSNRHDKGSAIKPVSK